MPSAIAYTRYSSEPQGAGDSRRRQVDLAKAVAKSRDLTISEWVEDLGVSAYRGQHVEVGNLGGLLDRVKARKIARGTCLLFENFDRLSRLHVFDSTRVILDLYDAGLILITTADNTLHERDQGLLGLLRPMLEGERAHNESARKADLLQRTWAAKRSRAVAGEAKITSICPAWLTPTRNPSGDVIAFAAIDDRAKIVQRIFQEAANGIGKYLIAARLNSDHIDAWRGSNGWHASYIHKILTNRAAIGEFQPHRKIERSFEPEASRRVGGRRIPEGAAISGYFPAVIDMALWERTRAARADRRGKGGRKGKRLKNLFSGLCSCSDCDSTMTFRSPGDQYGRDYLMCDSALRKTGCLATARHPYLPVEKSILAHLTDLLFDPADLDSTKIIDAENVLASLATTRRAKEREIKRLIDAIASGESPYLSSAINERTDEITSIKDKERIAEIHLEEMRGRIMTSDRNAALDALRSDLDSKDESTRLLARSRLAQEIRAVVTRVIFEQSDPGCIVIVVAHGLRVYNLRGDHLLALLTNDYKSGFINAVRDDPQVRNEIAKVIQRITRIQKLEPEKAVLGIFRNAIAEGRKNGTGYELRFTREALQVIVSCFPNLASKLQALIDRT
jgi:DNA invertase Pin-like site-specific DNA recombinase